MTFTIDLSPTEEAQFIDAARQEGLEPADFVKKLMRERLPSTAPSDPVAHVQALLAKWRAEDHTPTLPPVLTRPGETPTQALFRIWDEEDAALTEEEQDQRERLWEEFQQGVNETRIALGMRTIF